MIDVEELDGGLRVVDAAKNEVEIEVEGWEPGAAELEIDRRVDETVAGSAAVVRLPAQTGTIESETRSKWQTVEPGDGVDLGAGRHLFQADCAVTIFLRTDSAFAVRCDVQSEQTTIAFPRRAVLTLGFRSIETFPASRIRIPPSVSGLAAAISAFGDAHETGSPDRSYPSTRTHPPTITFDDDANLREIRETTSRREIELLLPPSLSSLFVAAPLAYYLGAAVEVEAETRPRLVTRNVDHVLPGGERFPDGVASLLSRVFYLDCLVRTVGPYGIDIRESRLLADLPLDPEAVYPLSIADRLEEYLAVPFEDVESRLPEWPLTVSLEPEIDNATALPHLLDLLAIIYPPKAATSTPKEWVERSLGDFYRSTAGRTASIDEHSSKKLSSDIQRGLSHAWIAEGTTLGAFKCPPEAFANGLTTFGDPASPLSVVVILNDDGMIEEQSEVIDVYRHRSEAIALEVDVRADLSCTELGAVFESPTDFVHYIGHCDPSGLRCRDGNLSIRDISGSRTKTFFLNACGSFEQAMELVRQGSVAGVATIGDVLDDQASKVGTTFARLLMRGFSLERSLHLASARAIMNKLYVAVGDATTVLTQSDGYVPAVSYVSERPGVGYDLRIERGSSTLHGGVIQPATLSEKTLVGSMEPFLVSPADFERYLHLGSDPIIFEDQFYWPDELLDELF